MGQLKVGFNLRGNRVKEKITIRPRLDVSASFAPPVRTSLAGGPSGAALPFIGSARASYQVGFNLRGNRVKEKIKIRSRLDVAASFAPPVRTSFASGPGGAALPFIGSARASYRVGFNLRGNRVKEKITIGPRLDVSASFTLPFVLLSLAAPAVPPYLFSISAFTPYATCCSTHCGNPSPTHSLRLTGMAALCPRPSGISANGQPKRVRLGQGTTDSNRVGRVIRFIGHLFLSGSIGGALDP